MHKISYDLPIGFYPRDFLFEKINKVYLDVLSVKILTSLGRISTLGSCAPSTWDSPVWSQYFDLQKIQTNLVYLFK